MKAPKLITKLHVLYAILFLSPVFLQGCVPIILAAAASSGYLAGDEDARNDVSGWLTDLNEKVRNINILGGDDKKETKPHDDRNGIVVEFNTFAITPATVKRGEIVTIDMEYVVVGAEGKGVAIQERRDLWFGGEKIVELESKEVKRKNGTWKNTTTFKVPSSAQVGKHKVNQILSTQNNKLLASGYFTVSTQH
jgi:hypothetical protein